MHFIWDVRQAEEKFSFTEDPRCSCKWMAPSSIVMDCVWEGRAYAGRHRRKGTERTYPARTMHFRYLNIQYVIEFL